MNIEDLIKDGWVEYPNQLKRYAHCFFKSFETPTRSAGNSDKTGIQACIFIHECDGQQWVELEICGKLLDGTWINLHNYSIGYDPGAAIKAIPRLLSVWEAAANFK